MSIDIFVGWSVTFVADFEYFGFRCQFSFYRMLCTRLSSGSGTIRLLLADIPSGHSLVSLHEINKLKSVDEYKGKAIPVTAHGGP
jgi:hypothetical protein